MDEMQGGNASYEPNMTRVDTGAIRETADRVRANLAVVREAQSGLAACAAAIESCWEGSAADEYLKVYRRLLGKLADSYEVYAKYPDLLVKHAERREQADTQARVIASNIEQATWVEV